MHQGNFFSELKRRNVYKVAVAYGVVGWLVVQVATSVLPTFHAPDWAAQTLIVLVLLGFPVALVIAWAFEMTPEGMKRTENISPDQPLPQWSRRKFAAVFVTLALVAAGLLGWQLTRSKILSPVTETTAAVSVPIPEKSIAVLPFENLSSDKENAYFADGIQDEILTRLATIADLRVISRTSTTKYKSKPEDLKTVSQQLGVANILEGSVQKAGEKVRVNVQLIDARSDSHLWAKTYDGEAKDIFALETEVSQQVADALRARLSPAETQRLADAPTNSAEAYDLFLKGEFEARAAEASLESGDFERADAFYRKALELDQNFALAHARRVMNAMQRHWYIDHLTTAELQPIQDEADRALQLAPNLPEAHTARG